MVTSAIKTFTQKVLWKDLDFIVVDMPPGTGDTQLTFSQEIKLDGVRAITIIYPSRTIDIFSRNGKELNNFDHLKDEIIKCLDFNELNKPIVLDGEIISKNFQELMKQIHRKNSIQNTDASLFLFDTLPLEDFKKGIYELWRNAS